MERYDSLMFTQRVKALQEAQGTAERYEKAYGPRTHVLNQDEQAFIASRTSFYMATVSETGWPYIQHRGGPVGFVKVLDDHTIGFADYRGNQQHISEGNLQGDRRVSLFFMDYPRKGRLKMQGNAKMRSALERPDLVEQFATTGEGRVERVVTIEIVAFDWNCPQFITPRFDSTEIAQLVGPELDKLTARIAELEAENAALRNAN